MKQKLTLTQKQEFALEAFAKIHGRNWKSVLRDAWMSGAYPYGSDSASLQQVRNHFGPSWLVSYRLPNLARKIRADYRSLNTVAAYQDQEGGAR